jgi:hypothetical protein
MKNTCLKFLENIFNRKYFKKEEVKQILLIKYDLFVFFIFNNTN